MRIITIIIALIISSTCACEKNVVKYGKVVQIPKILYGIDFSKTNLQSVVSVLQKKRITFKCYDWDEGNEFQWTGKKEDIERIGRIETHYFLGSNIDKSKIINVEYSNIYPYMAFQIKVVIKDEYYGDVFAYLCGILGKENANLNINGYDELSWNSKHDGESTDISSVIISKRESKYETIGNSVNQNVFYLVIRTEGNDIEKEYKNYIDNKKK